jgi:hypothetical protein
MRCLDLSLASRWIVAIAAASAFGVTPAAGAPAGTVKATCTRVNPASIAITPQANVPVGSKLSVANAGPGGQAPASVVLGAIAAQHTIQLTFMGPMNSGCSASFATPATAPAASSKGQMQNEINQIQAQLSQLQAQVNALPN